MSKTDKKMPPALVELIANPEAERARIDFLGMAEKLIGEGVPLRSVARGLAGAITTLIAQEYPKGNNEFLWAWHFLRELEGGFGYWREHLDLIEDVADEIVLLHATLAIKPVAGARRPGLPRTIELAR